MVGRLVGLSFGRSLGRLQLELLLMGCLHLVVFLFFFFFFFVALCYVKMCICFIALHCNAYCVVVFFWKIPNLHHIKIIVSIVSFFASFLLSLSRFSVNVSTMKARMGRGSEFHGVITMRAGITIRILLLLPTYSYVCMYVGIYIFMYTFAHKINKQTNHFNLNATTTTATNCVGE